MLNYEVECGDLKTKVQQTSITRAARGAVQGWYEGSVKRFSAITTVKPPKSKKTIFLTTNLLEQLGIEYDEGKDEEDNQVYKPRLCEHTAG